MLFEPSELLEKSPLGIVVSDHHERILWCNARFLEETRLDEEAVINKLYPSLPLEAIDRKNQLVQLFSDKSDSKIRFQYWQQSLVEPFACRVHYFAKERKTGARITLAESKLGNISLPKRISWVEFLDYEVSRSRRYNNPLSILKLHILILDIPDSTEQTALEQLIKDTLMDELRWADMIGHTEQGSYLMILPETPVEALVSLEQKLQQAIKKQITRFDEQIQYRLVFGKAYWQKNDDSQYLLKRARLDLVDKLEKLLSESES